MYEKVEKCKTQVETNVNVSLNTSETYNIRFPIYTLPPSLVQTNNPFKSSGTKKFLEWNFNVVTLESLPASFPWSTG